MKRTLTTTLCAVALFLTGFLLDPNRGSGSGTPAGPQQGRKLDRDKPNAPAGENRVALVIGNGAYAKGRLKNPPNDARAMAAVLREVGFEVSEVIDADKVRIQRSVRDFGKKLKENGGVGLFYYAGHGVQVQGKNYLIPIGAENEVEAEADVEIFCIDAENVLRQMEDAGTRINIVILDACRNNPFSKSFSRDTAGGLAETKAPSGTLIAYATDPGRTASDGDGVNGLYTEELLARIRQPGLRIEDVFNLVGAEVERKSGKKQQPWISSKLRGAFYFRPSGEAVKTNPDPVKPGDSGAAEREAWETVKDSSDPEDFREFLKNFPSGTYAGTARVKLRKLEAAVKPSPSMPTGTDTSSIPPTNSKPAMPAPGAQMEGAMGIKLVYIPAGEFQMGSPENEVSRLSEEIRHRVVISAPFWMGKFEVTQAQWKAVMGTNPSFFRDCQQCPVEQVSWEDCREFIGKLNAKGDGYVYALPTEAEWEYACRAGTTTPFSFGVTITTDQANFNGVPYGGGARGLNREKTVPVGSFNSPNAWGLHDMHGNIYEWCADWFDENYYRVSPVNDPKGPASGQYRVLRGGHWNTYPDLCRSACRSRDVPTRGSSLVGFRVVIRLPAK